MQIQFWASTDVGCVREHNEDNFLVDKRLKLFIVCDGMGGHAAGEVASALSVRTVRDVISANREVLEYLESNPDDISARQSVLQLLERSIHDANARVHEMGIEDESKRGMGTTCCVLLLSEYYGFIGHVGDSRIYLARNNKIHQMTEDHSLYNEMVRLGKIKPGEQVNLPNKNAVTRAVGVREFVEVDVMEFEAIPGDRFLLCSDGLCGYFTSDNQVLAMMQGGQLKDVTERCIRFAVDSGGKDNITAIMVDVEEVQEEVLHIPEPQPLDSTVEILKATPYFEYLNTKELQRVINLTQRIELEANDLIYDLDEVAQGLFIVLSGRIEIEGPGGELLSELGMGDDFGELGFIDAQPAEELAVAIERSVVLELPRKRLMELLRGEPELAVKILWNFLQIFTGRLREVSLAPPVMAAVAQVANLGEPVSEELTPPSGSRIPAVQTSAMAPSSSPEVTPPTWGHEETRKVMIDSGDAAGLAESTDGVVDDEDLRATAEFTREDIENFSVPKSKPKTESTQELDRGEIQVMAGVIKPKKINSAGKPSAPPSKSGPPGAPGAPPPLPPTSSRPAPRSSAAPSGGAVSGDSSTRSASKGISGSSVTTTSSNKSVSKPSSPRTSTTAAGRRASPGARTTGKPGAKPPIGGRPAVTPSSKPTTGGHKAVSGAGKSGAATAKPTRTAPTSRAGNSTPPGKSSPPSKGNTSSPGLVRRTSRDGSRTEQRTVPASPRANASGARQPGEARPDSTTVQLDVEDIRRHTSGDASGSSNEEKEL